MISNNTSDNKPYISDLKSKQPSSIKHLLGIEFPNRRVESCLQSYAKEIPRARTNVCKIERMKRKAAYKIPMDLKLLSGAWEICRWMNQLLSFTTTAFSFVFAAVQPSTSTLATSNTRVLNHGLGNKLGNIFDENNLWHS